MARSYQGSYLSDKAPGLRKSDSDSTRFGLMEGSPKGKAALKIVLVYSVAALFGGTEQ